MTRTRIARSILYGEADFNGHLPMLHFPLVDIAARFDHLKPRQIFDGFMGPGNGLANGVLNGSRGGAGQFDEFIDVIFHAKSYKLPMSLSFNYGV